MCEWRSVSLELHDRNVGSIQVIRSNLLILFGKKPLSLSRAFSSSGCFVWKPESVSSVRFVSCEIHKSNRPAVPPTVRRSSELVLMTVNKEVAIISPTSLHSAPLMTLFSVCGMKTQRAEYVKAVDFCVTLPLGLILVSCSLFEYLTGKQLNLLHKKPIPRKE